ILARDDRKIFLGIATLLLLKKPITCSSSDGQLEVIRQSKPARDEHVFKHVFEREVRLEIAIDHLWQFHRQCFGITGVVLERGYKLVGGNAGMVDKRARLGVPPNRQQLAWNAALPSDAQ